MNPNRRLRTLPLNLEAFLDLCKQGAPLVSVVENALPADVRILRAEFSYWTSEPLVQVLITSEIFTEVPEGEIIPEWPIIVFRQLR